MKYFNSSVNVSNLYPLQLKINARSCVIGEIFDERISACSICPLNTYSFNIYDKKCRECLPVMDCYGGFNVSLKPGYWRSNLFSENILECKPNPKSCMYIFLIFQYRKIF